MVSPVTERSRIVEQLPWVKRLKQPVPCEGIKWNKVSMKRWRAIQTGNIPEEVKCKNLAHWSFKALKKSTASSGNYCWSHLLYRGVHGNMEEAHRTNAWLAMYGDKNDG
jgi:hypothetical protein